MNKNTKRLVLYACTHTSNLEKIKIENNIKTFERFKLNVGADASVRPQTTDYRKLKSNNLTYNFPASNSAITLIALIITIIVLLILAGVTLNMVMGENGIIKKAQLAKEKTNEAQKSENEKLEELDKKVANYGDNRENNSIMDKTSISENNTEEFVYTSFSMQHLGKKHLAVGESKFGSINENGELTIKDDGMYYISSSLTRNTIDGQIYNQIYVNDKQMIYSFSNSSDTGIPVSLNFYAKAGDRVKVELMAYNTTVQILRWKVLFYKI